MLEVEHLLARRVAAHVLLHDLVARRVYGCVDVWVCGCVGVWSEEEKGLSGRIA